jgi:energy-converting hydrogenase Eha subunit E
VASVVVLAHALLGIVFFGGLFGRGIVLALAERADTLPAMLTLTKAARPFERIVIVIGSIAGVLGIAAAIAQGRPLLGPLQGTGIDWLFVSVVLVATTFPLPPLVFLPRGRVFETALHDATALGEVTPALRAAWRDPVVRASHVYELGVVSVVLVLMLTRPF